VLLACGLEPTAERDDRRAMTGPLSRRGSRSFVEVGDALPVDIGAELQHFPVERLPFVLMLADDSLGGGEALLGLRDPRLELGGGAALA
jgi:hypothetical protein